VDALRPISIGILGAGQLAEHVLFGTLRRLPAVRVAAIADPSEARRAVATRWFPGARIDADAAEMLAGVRLDAVVVSCPPAAHAEEAMRALDAGVHLYVEKPLATDLPAARALAERARTSGRVAMAGLNYRHHPLVRRLRDALGAGRIGAPLAMHTVFSTARAAEGWRASPESGGGVLFELGSHHFDLARFLFAAEIGAVTARVWSRRSGGDSAVVDLELTTGVRACMTLAMGAADEDHVFVLGEAGTAAFDRMQGDLVFRPREFRYGRRHSFARGTATAVSALAGAARRPGEPSYERALSAFLAAIRTGRPARPDFDDGVRSLEAVEAALRSSRSGTRVELGACATGALAP